MSTIRLRLSKTGRCRFISHLDTMRTLERAIRRAGIPLAFSKGFHPHPKISFAAPLALGISSEWELVDIDLAKDIGPAGDIALAKDIELAEETAAQDPRRDESLPNAPRGQSTPSDQRHQTHQTHVAQCLAIGSRLNAVLPPGLRVLSAGLADPRRGNLMARVVASSYDIHIPASALGSEPLDIGLGRILAAPSIQFNRERKESRTTVDVRPLIEDLSGEMVTDGALVRATLATGSQGSLRPDELISLLLSRKIIESTEGVRIHRTRLFLEGQEEELVSVPEES